MPIATPVLVPAVLAGVCLLVSWRMWRRRNLAEGGHWGGALAFGLGYAAGHVTLVSWPLFPPVKAVDSLAYLACAAGALGIAQRYWGKRWYTAWPVRIVVSAAFAAVLLRSTIEHTWSRSEAVGWIAGLTLGTVMLWDTLERLAAKRTGASLPLSLWGLCASSSVAFAMTGSALLGQLAGGLAAVCGAAVVLAWWAPGLSISGGAMAAFVPIFAGLLMQAYFFSELPMWSGLLIVIAPFLLWVGEKRNIFFMTPWKAALVRLALIAAPLAIALGLAAYVLVNTPDDTYYY